MTFPRNPTESFHFSLVVSFNISSENVRCTSHKQLSLFIHSNLMAIVSVSLFFCLESPYRTLYTYGKIMIFKGMPMAIVKE